MVHTVHTVVQYTVQYIRYAIFVNTVYTPHVFKKKKYILFIIFSIYFIIDNSS